MMSFQTTGSGSVLAGSGTPAQHLCCPSAARLCILYSVYACVLGPVCDVSMLAPPQAPALGTLRPQPSTSTTIVIVAGLFFLLLRQNDSVRASAYKPRLANPPGNPDNLA